MTLLYWAETATGGHHGVIQCQDGHIHLRDIPNDRQQFFTDLLAEFANTQDRLPPLQAQVSEFLEDKGCPRVEFNPPHIGFGDIVENAEDDGAPKDISKMGAPELKALAAELGIDATGFKTKGEYAKAIQDVLDAKDEDPARTPEGGTEGS